MTFAFGEQWYYFSLTYSVMADDALDRSHIA